jgi:hypothetical protein
MSLYLISSTQLMQSTTVKRLSHVRHPNHRPKVPFPDRGRSRKDLLLVRLWQIFEAAFL